MAEFAVRGLEALSARRPRARLFRWVCRLTDTRDTMAEFAVRGLEALSARRQIRTALVSLQTRPLDSPIMPLANEWRLDRERVSASAFGRGQVGPYRLGRPVRTTAAGEVILALHDRDPRVLELEILDPVRMPSLDPPLLQDVNQVMGLEHRHLSGVLGAGIHDGSVYLARVHHVGRTLAEVMETFSGPAILAAGIAYSVAEVLAYLEHEGPRPGASTFGGFDSRDVLLGFDGQVSMVGLGLRALRQPDRRDADLQSFRRLAADLDGWLGTDLQAQVPPGPPMADLVRGLRRGFREECGRRREYLGRFMRRSFPNTILDERAFFGLATLH